MIIGGGLAGAGAAIHLARAGLEVVLLEREAGAHDKVCGEFLSYEAVDSLRRLGVDPLALGAAPVERLAVCVGDRRVVGPLPFRALSLSRRVLDQTLLDRAQREGVEVKQGARVTRLERNAGGWRASVASGEEVEAAQVFLATGKHDLRGFGRPPGLQPDLIGFKIHLDLPSAVRVRIDREVAVHLFPGGYAGLEQVENGRANLCLLVSKVAFAEHGRDWNGLVEHLARACPDLAELLEAGNARRLKPLAISGIPYGHVQSRAQDGLWRLGDQAAVIPSLAGEGMAIALHSAELAAGLLLAGRGAGDYQQTLSRTVRGRVAGATLLSKALVGPAGPRLAALSMARAPGLPRQVARLTRLPRRAIARSSGLIAEFTRDAMAI